MADAALASICLALVVLEIQLGNVPQSAHLANLAAAPFMTLPLALRRRRPAVVALVALAAVKIEGLAGGSTANTIAPILPLSVAVYSLAVHAGQRSLVGGTITAAVLLVFATATIEDALFAGVLLSIPFALGLVVRNRQQHADRLQAEAGVAGERERQRIARELHDVVAHSVGVMTVQAAAGRRVLERNPEHAAAALEAIEAIGRQALAEMARIVGILRDPGAEQVLEPQPGLRHVHALLDQVRTAGLEVNFEIDATMADLPPGLDLAAYRIVQEALTNAIRHSSARHAHVSVMRRGNEVVIDVEDPGPARNGTASSGHGLVGMQERAHLYGGHVDAGRTPSGGFAVRARLPVEA
jgi:signal transduction histidine kinase